MNIDSHVYDALKILIKISENAQEAAQEQAQYMSINQWGREYCTVKASTARGGGHTTAILKLMEDNGMNIACIFDNLQFAKRFQQLDNSIKPHKGNLEFCHTWKNFERNIMGRDFSNLDALIIDNSFLMSKKKEDEIYSSIWPCLMPAIFHKTGFRPFFFIFLQ